MTMRTTTLGWSVLVSLGVTAACGGDTSSNRFANNTPDAGDASTGTGGFGGGIPGIGRRPAPAAAASTGVRGRAARVLAAPRTQAAASGRKSQEILLFA